MKRIYAAAWLLALALFAAPSAWAATNQLTMSGAASGTQPSVSANGVDTNISIILTPKGTGGVGIGTTAPQTTLQVNGSIMMGTGTCASTTAGSIQYSGGAVQYCNGTSWANIASGGGSITGSQYQMAYLSATNTAIGDANITTDAGNDLIVSGGTLSIGTTVVTSNAVNLTGQNAETIDMLREYTSSTAGKNLTISAGGAVAIGTNLNGGNLVLSSGIATGTGTSNIQFQTYPAGTSGTSDTTVLTAATLSATGASGTNEVTTLQDNAGSGTNKNGGTLTLASGISTGTGSSNINFNIYKAGTSGATANSATTAVTIASSGNVGIGTTVPSNKLDINGSLAVGTYAGTASGASNELIVGGNVGIGSASPQGVLDVEGGAAAGNVTPSNIYIVAQNATNGGCCAYGATGGNIVLIPGASAGSYNSGMVGIGTASPTAFFDVEGGSAAGNLTPLDIKIIGQSGVNAGANAYGARGGNILLVPGAAAGNYNSGYVGVGTTSPVALVDLEGTQQSVSAWTTTGLDLVVGSNTLMDVSQSGGTITERVGSSIGAPIFGANNYQTITTATSL